MIAKRGRGRPRIYPNWRPTVVECVALQAERDAAERLYSLLYSAGDGTLVAAEDAYIMARMAAPKIGD